MMEASSIVSSFILGLDVGSTTVKAVVVDAHGGDTLWRDYQRHETRQSDKVLEFLQIIARDVPGFADACADNRVRAFITGSGGNAIAPHIGAKFVQEVNAVCHAIEKFHPEAGSVVELGGQDAKIIVFKKDPQTGRKKKIPSMNDKCAGGTGAVIDKINAKLRIPADELCEQRYDGIKLHKVAGKCGVFAETDINSLQKQGIPNSELMASLFDAIVGQNLAVLTRGHTLRPHVILLGGPNTYIRGMREAWQHNIPLVWKEREVVLPEGVDPRDLIRVPENAQYYAAIGAVEYGRTEEEDVGVYRGPAGLDDYIREGRKKNRKGASRALWASREELEAFREQYRPEPFVPVSFEAGQTVRAFIGLDGGSTSTKAVLLSPGREVLAKAYQLSKGNPIEDTIEVLGALRAQVEDRGATLHVLGTGTTGYAKDILRDVLGADAAIVETVAHAESALHFYDDVDVICDVGGQDIKIMALQNGSVKDFKLNTQCSAGNGYFLQSTAGEFGVPVEQFADTAFSAESMPRFGYGCAVFMQSDIVDFQRQGWSPAEIMAGLAAVLPKNIWLYVAQIPNLARLGRRFVLQGGTQRNLAAVKAQVDFIRSRFRSNGSGPDVIVHRHCGESGAIGAAIEAVRLYENGRHSTFIGLDAVENISYTTTTSEDTRCHFCKNECLRTFVDVETPGSVTHFGEGTGKRRAVRVANTSGVAQEAGGGCSETVGAGSVDAGTVGTATVRMAQGQVDTRIAAVGGRASKVPLAPGARRLIVNNSCEKGLVEDVDAMREIKKGLDAALEAAPNFVAMSAREVFRPCKPESVADEMPRVRLTPAARRRVEAMHARAKFRIGIPRLLNQYSTNPLFSAYFESLGIGPRNLVYSDYTNEELYKEGAKRGAIDPCFPSKLGIPHVHNLLFHKHAKKKLDVIFFPMIDDLRTDLVDTVDCRACPTVTATPEAVKAAFTKEEDLFAKKGVEFLNPLVNISLPPLFARQMYATFGERLGLSKAENRRAVEAGYEALDAYEHKMRRRARGVLDKLVAERRLGIVVLGRPYHNDPGINHEILVEFQKLGYPVFTQDCLPIDADLLDRLFGDEVRAGVVRSPMAIDDVWKNAYSENTNRKVWAAKYVARHPNLVALELSNFKCGHDAPIYATVEETIERSGTPYFSFKDLDENRPSGSIKIRVETISYFLTRYREEHLGASGQPRRERRMRSEAPAMSAVGS